jgi:hypothetical protein
MNVASERNKELAVELRERLQSPKAGPIHIEHLVWEKNAKGNQEVVLLQDRAEDFVKAQTTIGVCKFLGKSNKNKPGVLDQPRYNSYLETTTYRCQYGPEDLSQGKPGGHQGNSIAYCGYWRSQECE